MSAVLRGAGMKFDAMRVKVIVIAVRRQVHHRFLLLCGHPDESYKERSRIRHEREWIDKVLAMVLRHVSGESCMLRQRVSSGYVNAEIVESNDIENKVSTGLAAWRSSQALLHRFLKHIFACCWDSTQGLPEVCRMPPWLSRPTSGHSWMPIRPRLGSRNSAEDWTEESAAG